MKHKVLSKIGKFLMKITSIRICIIDDEDIYFNKNMLNIATNTGFNKIDRHSKVDHILLSRLQKKPYDIIILDVQGITEPDVAKDGMQIAALLNKTTNSYIVVTSAHQFHLINEMTAVDYIIENKLLTTTDFIDELTGITEDYLTKKSSFYKNILFKMGFAIMKKSIS